jgi:hypothetical protein
LIWLYCDAWHAKQEQIRKGQINLPDPAKRKFLDYSAFRSEGQMKVDREEINRTTSLDAVTALCIQTIHFTSISRGGSDEAAFHVAYRLAQRRRDRKCSSGTTI